MNDLDDDQRAQIVIWVAQNHSFRQTCTLIRRNYGVTVPPISVKRMYERFQQKGGVSKSSDHSRKNTPNNPKSARTVENEIRVMQHLAINPSASQREVSRDLELSLSTVNRMIKDCGFRPYRLQLMQELSDDDKIRRMEFCNWIIDKINNDAAFLDSLIMSDEAKFYTNGTVNLHNAYYYDVENPNYRIEKPSAIAQSLNVWIGITSSCLIGPYFFQGNINGPNYLEMLENFLIPEMDAQGLNAGEVWFQQDGAPGHRTNQVIQFLQNTFGEKIIALNTNREWPPRSPDLTVCDFFCGATSKT